MIKSLNEYLPIKRIVQILAHILSYCFLVFGLIVIIKPSAFVSIAWIYSLAAIPNLYLVLKILTISYLFINHFVVSKYVERRIILIFEAMSVLWVSVCLGTFIFRIILTVVYAGLVGKSIPI